MIRSLVLTAAISATLSATGGAQAGAGDCFAKVARACAASGLSSTAACSAQAAKMCTDIRAAGVHIPDIKKIRVTPPVGPQPDYRFEVITKMNPSWMDLRMLRARLQTQGNGGTQPTRDNPLGHVNTYFE